ncbi:MAG TPA: lipid-binding SYLF domain-containing protein [Blastocatellia bacterium]|nr:lipid-binding SYLF domain-containing protein [Blastocatellia bacterium]
MKKIILHFCLLSCVLSVFGICCLVQSMDLKDQTSQVDKSARVFREIMATPDKSIPRDLLRNAKCVAVFPSVIKAGFIVGGRGGRGVVSCKSSTGWSGPVFLNLKGGSVGLQIGAQATDFVLLFMNDKGIDSLLSDKFELGGDASVAAGPVGRQSGASTDVKLQSEILSYSRSRGLFAGLELKGVVISQDKDDNKGAYGDDFDAKAILRAKLKAPFGLRAFSTTLDQYTRSRTKSKKG